MLEDQYLGELLERLDELADKVSVSAVASAFPAVSVPQNESPRGKTPEGSRVMSRLLKDTIAQPGTESPQPFFPESPKTLAAAKISEALVDSLVLKFLLSQVSAAGRAIAEQVGLPFAIIVELLGRLKKEQMVVLKGAGAMGDFVYQLTEQGHASALRMAQHGTYCAAAPVHLDDYLASVAAQSVRNQPVKLNDVARALADLSVEPLLLNQVSQALDAGRGFFLHGGPGNGKTSIAQRVTRVFGQQLWIPRAICVDSEVIQLFDPSNHVEVEPPSCAVATYDRRWACIRRPAIVVGGELTLDQLEITPNAETGACEAPLQLKSNGGVLVIDDFGRQRVSVADLLNRWIVPLDQAVDFLRLPSSKTIRVPFDQLLVFSTNLEPRDLVDEAFLRRIPYKIMVSDPDQQEMHTLFRTYGEQLQIAYDKPAVDSFIERHCRAAGRSLRRCHARDLLLQIRHFARVNDLAPVMSVEYFEIAARNYFAVAGPKG